MMLNLEENGSELCWENGKFGKKLMDGDGLKFDEGSPDISELLPSDPFGMELDMISPHDPSCMDPNISLPKDPFGMDVSIEVTVAGMSDLFHDFGSETCGWESGENCKDGENGDGEFVVEVNFMSASAGAEGAGNSGSVVCLENESWGVQELLYSETEELFGAGKYQDNSSKSLLSGDKDFKDEENGDGQFVLELNFFCASVGSEEGNDAASSDSIMCLGTGSCDRHEEIAPPYALSFAFGHLGVRDLLSVQSVCRSLRDEVQNDPLLWRNIAIDYPMCNLITDDYLVRLTDRAHGTLHSLSLEKCLKITGSGLRHVLEANLRLTKLSVAGCIRLNARIVFEQIKIFNSVARPGIKQLRIGGLVGVNYQLFKDFNLLLGVDDEKNNRSSKPRFYSAGELYLSFEDNRPIDIETCPRCHRPGQVYDCPAECCRDKIDSVDECRACIFCISRCICCGCCLEDRAFEETFLMESLCFDCLAQLVNRHDKLILSTRSRVTLVPRPVSN